MSDYTTGLAMRLAKTIMRRYESPSAYPYRPWSYPQGYLLMGFAHLHAATGDEELRRYILRFCEERTAADGSVQGFTGVSMDDIMPGAVLAWAYGQTGEERYAAALHTIRGAFNDYPRTREGGFLHDRSRYPGEMWADGVFMGQMFMLRYAGLFKPADYDEAVRQLALVHRYCHRQNGLLCHAYSEGNLAPWATRPDGQSGWVWGEGLGWYALICAEALELLPRSHPGYAKVLRQYRQLAGGLAATQHEGGLWRQVVDATTDAQNWCDTSGSAMFLYALGRGVQKGWLEKAAYEEPVQRAWAALQTRCVPAADGGLDIVTACEGLCVQNSYEDYIQYPQKTNAQEAVAGVLWAAALMEHPHA